MATIEIIGWKGFIGGSGWDAHAKSELKKRLRSGVIASQHEIKHLVRQIEASEILTLPRVREEAVLSVIQILGILGAETRVKLEDSNDERLFKKWPSRERRLKSDGA